MMKKLFIFMLILSCMTSIFSTTDWEKGYQQGYSDAMAGLPNKFERQNNKNSNNSKSNQVGSFNGVRFNTVKRRENNWTSSFYYDSFGDKTENKYITPKGSQKGTFSNSATINSPLVWNLEITYHDVDLKLLEYGKYPVTGHGRSCHRLSVKEENGKISTFTFDSFSNHLTLPEKEAIDFIEILKKEGIIKLSLLDINYFNSSYNLGELDCKGFNLEYEKLPKNSGSIYYSEDEPEI